MRDRPADTQRRRGKPSDIETARRRAKEKLDRIISQYGDAGGARREPWYLEQLVTEATQAIAFARMSEGYLALEMYEKGVKRQPV